MDGMQRPVYANNQLHGKFDRRDFLGLSFWAAAVGLGAYSFNATRTHDANLTNEQRARIIRILEEQPSWIRISDGGRESFSATSNSGDKVLLSVSQSPKRAPLITLEISGADTPVNFRCRSPHISLKDKSLFQALIKQAKDSSAKNA